MNVTNRKPADVSTSSFRSPRRPIRKTIVDGFLVSISALDLGMGRANAWPFERNGMRWLAVEVANNTDDVVRQRR